MGLGFDHEKQRAEEISKVTLDDIRRVAQKYFRDGKSVEVVVGPAPSKAGEPLHDPTK
jgi:predicted Zn-dependent peptidase